MLTRDTLESFLDYIPREKLARTFKDAIDATRQLGLDFVWIDALCIIQKEPKDLDSDWAKEAGRLSSVYGGAFVTLAASTATSVSEGFLRRPQIHQGSFFASVNTSEYCRVQNFHS